MAGSEGEEERSRPLSRGELLKRAGVIGATAAIPAAVRTETASADPEVARFRELRTLSPTQATTIGAFVERLIPSDASGPGAREANVLRYIDRALAGDLFVFRASYVAAVQAIDAYANLKYGSDFAALSTAQQDAILTDMDQNKATGFNPNAKAVFEMIRGHAVEGMFGDPAHGGNTNYAGWKLVRFPGPRLVISAHEQKLNVVPKSALKSAYELPLFKKSKLARR
jgi:gluconate 2-dehydrogenase gamma chain